jgi:hypothetical protein
LGQKKVQNRRILKHAVAVEKGSVADMMVVLQKGSYFRPLASNFPVINAALIEGNDIFGFQMTEQPPSKSV